MLVEEPGSPPRVGRTRAPVNSRLRAKRVEIITGISQQAALAIQNHQLQQEMLVRERLEREMQLAREIQQTFLPDQLPGLPGWQVNVWWRTARETGGDFYDLIDLPGNRLGIVIADVADKGLPAALFMTLIRTLVRAAVREGHPPAEVLEVVNNLLIPDARHGTFVTIVYAVLDPATGQLTYANAGHNPPLWVRTSLAQIDLFPRSGMALGVVEDNPVDQRAVTLLPGDFLVLYTDGVTDAFSPQGLPYGFERLHQVVSESAFAPPGLLSAGAMMEAIDQSINDFIGDEPAADDSTGLVFYFESPGA